VKQDALLAMRIRPKALDHLLVADQQITDQPTKRGSHIRRRGKEDTMGKQARKKKKVKRKK